MNEVSYRADVENRRMPDEGLLENESGLEINGDDDSLSIYPNAEVRVEKVQFSILHLKRLYEDRRELILNPDFQRKDVWKGKQRSELIESILMGIPIPITRLNNQEMRNALYGGKATALLKELSESDAFLKATERGVSSTRMKDQYIILRTLAFLLWLNSFICRQTGRERKRSLLYHRKQNRVSGGNTYRLNKEEMKQLLLKLQEIREDVNR